MLRGRALVLLVLLVCSVIAGTAEARRSRRLKAGSNAKADFDFFFLVRQWPATFCNDHYCTHRPPKKYEFTLHGMWPQRRDGTWPEYCDRDSHIDMDKLDDLVDEMEHEWPSWSSADETFWDHEWNRHGTCAAPVTGDQHRFFGTVLSLHHKLNIQAALSAANITPSNSRRYPVQDIKDAIEKMYGVMPHVTCDGKGELSEVWMCINKKLKVIDCVEDPRPGKNSKSAPAAAAGQQTDTGDLSSAPAPPNYNCNMVLLPKLQKHWGKKPSLDAVQPAGDSDSSHSHHQHHAGHHHKHKLHHHDHHDDDEEDAEYVFEAGFVEVADKAVAELAAAVQPMVQLAADAVQELAGSGAEAVKSSADDISAGLSSVAASLAAVEQAAATVAISMAEAVTATAAGSGVDSAAVVGDAAAGNVAAPVVEVQQQQQQQQQPAVAKSVASTAVEPTVAVVAPGMAVVAGKLQQHAVAGPNQHLPLLAAVVVGVVAAAVVAAAVALRAAPAVDAKCSRKGQGYVPPGIPFEPQQPVEALPLLASSNKV